MKKTDIALIIIIVSISAGISYWIASVTINQSNEKPIIVRTVDEIKVGEEEVVVDEAVFSKDGINPTVEATISGEDLTSFIDDNANGTEGTDEPSDNETPNEE